MASTIKLKRGSGVPSGGSLAAGEPALDLTNNKLYSSTDGTDVVEISPQATLTGLGVTSTAAELNVLDGITATTAELNILDGVTTTATEVNYLNNVFIDITAAGGGDGTGRISIGNTDVTSSGSGVVAIGDSALGSLSTSGSWGNVGIGYKAGQGITTGDSNICIGHQAGSIYTGGSGTPAPEIGTGFNNIILGFRSFPSTNNASDEITLGNNFHTNLRCNDTSISTLSDARDKTDIVDSTYGVEWLKGVKVRKYKWQSREGNGKDGLTRLGFIAQELQEACGECNAILDIVQENNPDQLEIKMSNLIPILTKAIQELAARVEELEAS